jgi:acyl carrier protein
MGTVITASEIDLWLIDYLADLLEVPADAIDPTANFQELGLDSSLAISLTGDLEEWLGRRINPTLLYTYTTIESLSGGLAEEMAVSSS